MTLSANDALQEREVRKLIREEKLRLAFQDILDFLGPCSNDEVKRGQCASHGYARLPCPVQIARNALESQT